MHIQTSWTVQTGCQTEEQSSTGGSCVSVCLRAAEMQLDAGATVSQAKGVSWRSCKYQVRDALAVEVCSKQSDSVQRTED